MRQTSIPPGLVMIVLFILLLEIGSCHPDLIDTDCDQLGALSSSSMISQVFWKLGHLL